MSNGRKRRRGRARGLARRAGDVYIGTIRAYRRWWKRILPLAALIFIPLDLIDRQLETVVESFGPQHAGHVAEVIGLLLAMFATALTSLLGEVLLAGMISLSLASPPGETPPSIGEIARRLKYVRLILLDIVFVLIVLVGGLLLIIPGALAFLFFSLAGPVVELEHRRIFAAFRRSARLVRTDFWLVLWVLYPIQILSRLATTGIEHAGLAVLGDGHIASEIADVASEILISPFFAIAAVLLTLRLAARMEGRPAVRNV